MTENELLKKTENLERRITSLENLFIKKQRDDNDLLYNLDEGNFSEEFLRKLKGGKI